MQSVSMLVNVVLPNNMTNTSGLLSYNELITYIRIKVGDRFYDYTVKPKKGNIGETIKVDNFDPTVDKITITNFVVRHNGTNSTINTTGKIRNIQVYSY